jgi:hypothetical protein
VLQARGRVQQPASADAPEPPGSLAGAARTTLGRYRPDPERQAHLVMRIHDPRHAQHWRGWQAGTSGRSFEDALSSEESTATGLASQLARTGAQQLLLCGDSTLTVATLVELARQAPHGTQIQDVFRL